MKFIKDLISPKSNASSKRFAYLLGTTSSIVWLSIELGTNGMTPVWKDAFLVYMGTIGFGYVGGRVADKFNTKQDGTNEK